MCPRLSVLLLVLLVSGGSWPSKATAEERKASQAITVNPVFITAGWFNAEYERTLTSASTWGASYSRYSPAGQNAGGYRGVKAMWRYYAKGTALEGKWLGLRAGRSRLWDQSTPTSYSLVGLEMGYTEAFGPSQRLVMSLGIGASRLFGRPEYFPKVFPSFRANIGVAW